MELASKTGGFLAGRGCGLAGLVPFGLGLPGFLHCCCAGGLVDLRRLGRLLLDLFSAGLGTVGPVGGSFQLGPQDGGLLLCCGAALLGFLQGGA